MNYWACIRPQYSGYGTNAGMGWHYAVPWREEKGYAPRDMFLSLDTIDYAALLQARAPLLQYHDQEMFLASGAGVLADAPTTELKRRRPFAEDLLATPPDT